jgi:hypothetical protein
MLNFRAGILAVALAMAGTLRAAVAPPAPVIVTPQPTPESAALSIRLEKKDPGAALKKAFWPGILIHGWGHREAGDYGTFTNLAGAELFGAVVLGFGLAEYLGPEIPGENKGTSQSIALGGGAIMLTSWLWDVVGAPGAARQYNADHGLTLIPRSNGLQVALRF